MSQYLVEVKDAFGIRPYEAHVHGTKSFRLRHSGLRRHGCKYDPEAI
jgi:hypothetical protein